MFHHVSPCFTMFHHVSPCFTMFHHVSPCFTMFHHVSPCFTMFHHVSPCFTMFHHVSPCFTMFHRSQAGQVAHPLPLPRRSCKLSAKMSEEPSTNDTKYVDVDVVTEHGFIFGCNLAVMDGCLLEITDHGNTYLLKLGKVFDELWCFCFKIRDSGKTYSLLQRTFRESIFHLRMKSEYQHFLRTDHRF